MHWYCILFGAIVGLFPVLATTTSTAFVSCGRWTQQPSRRQPQQHLQGQHHYPQQKLYHCRSNALTLEWAFGTIRGSEICSVYHNHHHDDDSDDTDDDKTSDTENKRRQVLRSITTAILSIGIADTAMPPVPALAKDDALFRRNPLTNPLLEKIRIWNQAEADEMKYGGELERGEAEKDIVARDGTGTIPIDNNNKSYQDTKESYYGRLLIPILVMADELEQVNQIVQQTSTPAAASATAIPSPAPTLRLLLQQAQEILSQSKYNSMEFKKVFNAYGDNIYYTDPDRANLYLGGGAIPKTSQSLAYLLRNSILTNIQDMRAEIDYLLSSGHHQNSKTDDDDSGSNSSSISTTDLVQMAVTAQGAMTQYLNEIVPPNEIEQARTVMNQQQP